MISSFKCHVELVPVDGARKQTESIVTYPAYSKEVGMFLRLGMKCAHVHKTCFKPSEEKALEKLLYGFKFSKKHFSHNWHWQEFFLGIGLVDKEK